MKEQQRSYSAYFLTLSYDNENIPITQKKFMSLKKRDTQLFWKRYRKAHGKRAPIRYFLCGEYGSKTDRPHYHAIVFNVDLKIFLGEKQANNATAYPDLFLNGHHHFNNSMWTHGWVSIGQVTEASVGYCLKYMMKTGRFPKFKGDDRTPEFQCMSKGIGSGYLTEAMHKWHHDDLLNRMYCAILDGKKIAMPRYYKNKVYTDEQRKTIGNHVKSTVQIKDLTGKQEYELYSYSVRQVGNARLDESF